MTFLFLPHRSLLRVITNPQNVQFHADVIKNAETHIANVSLLAIVHQRYVTSYNLLNEFFQQNSKMFETEIVVHEDTNRDFLTRAAAAKVKYFYTYARTPEDKEDARRLDFIFDTYKQAEKKDYKAETTYLRRLIANLREWPALLAKFGLTENINDLEVANEGFGTSYDERSQARQLIHLKGDMKNLRVNANKAFANLCDAITGLLLTPLAADIKTELESIVLVINRHIQEYTVIYHRHAGISGHSPGDNGGNGDGGDDGEDGGDEGNGEGGDIQTPDIDNPPPFGE